jgi:glycosyltransferase involved in cell wall biosynthesis
MMEIAIIAISVSTMIIIGPRNPPEVTTVYRNLLNIGLSSPIYSVIVRRIPITVLILTKNEEKAIRECIESVKAFAQIIVIDSGSTDRTCLIAEGLRVEIEKFDWNGRYPKKKQWAMSLKSIKHDWVLFLDADERPSAKLVEEIRQKIDSDEARNISAYLIPLEYHFLNKKLRYGHKVKKISLLKRNDAYFPVIDDLHVTNMWEVEGHYQPIVSGRVSCLKGQIIHDDPDSLYDYFARHNRYSDWEAELRSNASMRASVRKARTRQGRIFERIPIKPVAFFLYSFLYKLGWRDGKAGFHYALALSFYYWQISLKAMEKR